MNNTINGNCSGCGKCCTNILAVSEKEIQVIKAYIKKHNIKPINYCNVLSNEYINICPFLNSENKCNIYEVRPEICKRFLCSEYKTNAKNFNHLDKIIINMLKTFDKNAYQPNVPDIQELNKMYQEEKKKIRNLNKEK